MSKEAVIKHFEKLPDYLLSAMIYMLHQVGTNMCKIILISDFLKKTLATVFRISIYSVEFSN